MKKIFLGLAVLGAALTSCDMDTQNYGVIGSDNGIENMSDAANFLNGIYINLRSISVGDRNSAGDIQADYFVGTIDYGNRMGNFSSQSIVASDQDIANYYNASYNAINAANYFIPKCEALLEKGDLTEDQQAKLKGMMAVAHFTRAYAYWWVFDKCVNYKVADLDAPGKGLQIVTVYNPTGNRGSYVGRSTIRESLTYIDNELTTAFNDLQAWEASSAYDFDALGPNTANLSSYTVAALQARMAILTGDYKTALEKSEFVINSGLYELSGIDDYKAIWVNDSGNELLFVPFGSNTQGGGYTIGATWVSSASKNTSDYLPIANLLNIYGDGDVRFDSFFELYDINAAGVKCYAFAFSKFPGNPELWTTTSNNLQNKAKPFRLSELYLIAAEAAAADGPVKNEAKANQYLTDLREARIEGYTAQDYSGSALVNAIRTERYKELVGEGFRLSDLRRWGLGFTRKAELNLLPEPLDGGQEFVQNSTDNITVDPGAFKLTWPIPYREMSVNPQLKGQQNPGY